MIRDRIKELRRVRAKDLLPNPKNWRLHTKVQAAALRGLLAEVGYADALLARELPTAGCNSSMGTCGRRPHHRRWFRS